MSIADQITRLQGAKADLKASIEAKGVTVPSEALIDEYPALVESIPQGGGGVPEKDVNFYDYDGTCVYSYTKDEFLALSALPANPDHSDEGLVSDGWSGTLAEAKNIVSKCGFCDLGQYYYPLDGKTKFYIHLDSACDFSFYVITDYQKTTLVEWGDGSSTSVSSTGQKTHTYAEAGDYIISLSGGPYSLQCNSMRCLPANTVSQRFVKNIKKIVIGTNCKIGSNAFSFLECPVIFPRYFNAASNIGGSLMHYRYFYVLCGIAKITKNAQEKPPLHQITDHCLSSIIILPLSISSENSTSDSYCFADVYTTRKLIIPNGSKSFSVDICRTTGYNKIVIPESIISLGTSAWGNTDCCVDELYCLATTPPTVSSLSNITNNVDLKIYVPADSVDAYKGATNWSAAASKIFAIPTA